MDKPIHDLELEFSRLEAELNHTSSVLEVEATLDSQSSTNLLCRLYQCKKDLIEAEKIVDSIVDVRGSLLEIVQLMYHNSSRLTHIHSILGPGSNDEMSSLNSSIERLSDIVSHGDNDLKQNSDCTPPPRQKDIPDKRTRFIETVEEPPLLEQESRSNTFIPISEEEFSQISSIIKGRTKLIDLNDLYRGLFDAFAGGKKKGILTHEKAVKMGLKITGQTGEARLNTLRQLRIIQLSKKGITWAD
ncbi:hypothetical protein RCL1_006771 [Eukaryota sp. TZLM3-RCL]